jgi:molybdopterin-guanine dinucleotide biosynthesis protein A
MTLRVAAIVLAGGRSSRFGRDKLLEPIDGRPLLHHAIDAVRTVSDEIVVVAGAGDGGPDVPDDVRIVHDESPFEGPLVALSIGLGATDAGVVLVVGGDMPTLVPAVLGRLTAALDDPSVDGAVLDGSGHRRPLPMALRRAAVEPVARDLVERGEHRLRALRDAIRLAVIPDPEWLADDPDGATLRDVDTPADL